LKIDLHGNEHINSFEIQQRRRAAALVSAFYRVSGLTIFWCPPYSVVPGGEERMKIKRRKKSSKRRNNGRRLCQRFGTTLVMWI